MIIPSSNLFLLKCPLEIDNLHQLTFSNSNTQYNYFSNLPKIGVDDFTYQRENNIIRYPSLIDNIRNYNYVMYQNENYSNKWFYAFITEMNYINDEVTFISIKTDVWQTWQFDLIYKKSFVEREHVTNDSVGAHTLPENVMLGEYITTHVFYDTNLGEYGVVLGSTTSPIDGTEQTGVYNGVPSGVGYYGYYFNELDILQEHLQYLTNNGKQSGITGIFIAPQILMNYTHNGEKISSLTNPREYNISIPIISNLNSYIPKNKKLLTYPYCYTSVSNGNGGTIILQPQLWTDYNNQQWHVVACLSPGCSIAGMPQGYGNEATVGNIYQLNGGKYPILNYSVDLYTNWQTENGLNQTIGLISGTTDLITGSVSALNGQFNINALVGGIESIATSIFNDKIADRIPPQVSGNTNCGDVNFSNGSTSFTFHSCTIKREYAKIIDDFFSMFGYKVDSLKVPNLNTRPNWNYVKTIGMNIEGNIPQKDIEQIKDIFNNGVTLWHNPSTFLNYDSKN